MNKDEMRAVIKRECVIQPYQADPYDLRSTPGWLFDFRAIILQPHYLETLTKLLYELVPGDGPVQFCGLESASIPLVTALTLRVHQDNRNANGLYIRKSRKKTGLYKRIEGTPTPDPVIVVDDLVNTGSSIVEQIEVLEREGHTVVAVVCLVAFRPQEEYTHLRERGIPIRRVYDLTDFELQLSPAKNIQRRVASPRWTFTPRYSAHFVSTARPQPILHDSLVITTSDEPALYALDAATGQVCWQYATGLPSKGKGILSTPCVHNDRVYFGAYDGTVYALEADTGKLIWRNDEADWVGSSPAIDSDSETLFIGLEHADPDYNGSVVALDVKDGSKKWHVRMPALTHASPYYLKNHDAVAIGGNEGRCYLLDARTGEVRWQYMTSGGRRYAGHGGFSPGDIKLAPAYDAQTDTLVFTSMDGSVYLIKASSGELIHRLSPHHGQGTPIGIYASPVIYNTTIIWGGLDKVVYAYDIVSGELLWRVVTSGRIFTRPCAHRSRVYIGSNDGVVYVINPENGDVLDLIQFPERVSAPVTFTSEGNMLIRTNCGAVYAVNHNDTKV